MKDVCQAKEYHMLNMKSGSMGKLLQLLVCRKPDTSRALHKFQQHMWHAAAVGVLCYIAKTL